MSFEDITLNPAEQLECRQLQTEVSKWEEIQNATQDINNSPTGYEIDITSLTQIIRRVSEQKFYQIAPAEYLPVTVGEGAFSSNLVQYRSFDIADSFETGVVNTGGNGSRLAEADGAVDSVSKKVVNWAKATSWSLFDLRQAARAGNFDLVTTKEKSRKRNWDLGIQRIAFLGMESDPDVDGLLNQTEVTSDITTITEPLSQQTDSEFQATCTLLLQAYRSNSQFTAKPTHFIIPEEDFNGLVGRSTTELNVVVSRLEYLQKILALGTMNPDFKVLPLVYGDQGNNNLSINRYVMLNYDEDSLRMDLPVDYTTTLQNSINGFNYVNVGYGQYTGVLALRPREILYFDFADA